MCRGGMGRLLELEKGIPMGRLLKGKLEEGHIQERERNQGQGHTLVGLHKKGLVLERTLGMLMV